jgi:hypothetical protein
MALYILIGWLVFLTIFYLAVFIEFAYYEYNLPQKFRIIMEAFTEEETEDE